MVMLMIIDKHSANYSQEGCWDSDMLLSSSAFTASSAALLTSSLPPIAATEWGVVIIGQ